MNNEEDEILLRLFENQMKSIGLTREQAIRKNPSMTIIFPEYPPVKEMMEQMMDDGVDE